MSTQLETVFHSHSRVWIFLRSVFPSISLNEFKGMVTFAMVRTPRTAANGTKIPTQQLFISRFILAGFFVVMARLPQAESPLGVGNRSPRKHKRRQPSVLFDPRIFSPPISASEFEDAGSVEVVFVMIYLYWCRN